MIIIGGMRCGTTSLFKWLSQHPEICPCMDKEPAFFSNESVWLKGLDWYCRQWPWDSSRHRVALEASTNYSKVSIFPHTAQRLREIAPHARLIYLMRDPIARLESHYTLGAAKGWRESSPSLDEGMHPHLIECSSYAKQIDAYRDYFDGGQLLLLTFEELRDAPQATLGRICRYCGIDYGVDFTELAIAHNSNAGRRPGEVGQLLYRIRRWLPFWHVLSRHISSSQQDRIRHALARRNARNSALPDAQRHVARAALSDDLLRLRTVYGVDTSRWPLVS